MGPRDDYAQLMAGAAAGDGFDRHLLACALAIALAEPGKALAEGLGLSAAQLAALIGRHFPHAADLLRGCGDGAAPASIEEPDLRTLLLDHAGGDGPETEWLAAIVARRSLNTNHLWQDLGLPGRADLSALMRRHFAPLAAKNDRDMKWKKFF
ncbi:MAG: nitrogen fixation protein NifQ, partial [Magnetospirillum sp.]|nr:nitrogen fixation protein NifQ [Magnetospirillum sp.]